jgi:uncharacterized protein (TIGR03435 family)
MGMVQFTSPGGRFRASATSLKYLMEWAYGIQPSQHSAGPSWLGNERYDIVAKAPGNASDEEMKLMVQGLLADRFQLKMHHESKKMLAYVISVGKTAPKLETPQEGEVHSIKVIPQKDQDQKVVSWHVVATRFSLAQLTDTFARQLGRVIVNKTGMNGDYDFTLDMTPDENSPNPLDPTLIMDAMRKQLGLTLKTEDTMVDYIVIDGAERVKAGN